MLKNPSPRMKPFLQVSKDRPRLIRANDETRTDAMIMSGVLDRRII